MYMHIILAMKLQIQFTEMLLGKFKPSSSLQHSSFCIGLKKTFLKLTFTRKENSRRRIRCDNNTACVAELFKFHVSFSLFLGIITFISRQESFYREKSFLFILWDWNQKWIEKRCSDYSANKWSISSANRLNFNQQKFFSHLNFWLLKLGWVKNFDLFKTEVFLWCCASSDNSIWLFLLKNENAFSLANMSTYNWRRWFNENC